MLGLFAVLGFIALNAAVAPLIGVLQGKTLAEWWRS